jgi:hypothetical protein
MIYLLVIEYLKKHDEYMKNSLNKEDNEYF